MKQSTTKKDRQRAWALKMYARLSLLALAAMATARLILFAIDIVRLRAGTVGGEIFIPTYAVIFIYTGWKLKSWTAGKTTRKGQRKCTTMNVTAAGATSTRANYATASARRSAGRGV